MLTYVFLCFFKNLVFHICLALVFPSLSLPDGSIPVSTAPPITVCSYNTRIVLYPSQGFSVLHSSLLFFSITFLRDIPSCLGYILRHVKPATRPACQQSRCISVTCGVRTQLLMLLKSFLDIIHSSCCFSRNSECTATWEHFKIQLLPMGPSHLLCDPFYCSADVRSHHQLFILSFYKHQRCGKSPCLIAAVSFSSHFCDKLLTAAGLVAAH